MYTTKHIIHSIYDCCTFTKISVKIIQIILPKFKYYFPFLQRILPQLSGTFLTLLVVHNSEYRCDNSYYHTEQ